MDQMMLAEAARTVFLVIAPLIADTATMILCCTMSRNTVQYT